MDCDWGKLDVCNSNIFLLPLFGLYSFYPYNMSDSKTAIECFFLIFFVYYSQLFSFIIESRILLYKISNNERVYIFEIINRYRYLTSQ